MFMTSRMKGWSFPTNEESRETKLCFKTQQECSMQMNDQQTKNVYGQQKDFQIEICNYVQNKFPFQPKAHTHHLCQRSKSKVIPQLGHESNKAITQKVYVYIYIYYFNTFGCCLGTNLCHSQGKMLCVCPISISPWRTCGGTWPST